MHFTLPFIIHFTITSHFTIPFTFQNTSMTCAPQNAVITKIKTYAQRYISKHVHELYNTKCIPEIVNSEENT